MKIMKNLRLAAVAAVLLTSMALSAQESKPGMSAPEVNYQAGSSPLGDVPMYQSTNPKAPKMTQAELDRARQIYIER